MRQFISILALGAVALAQSIEDIPSCAQDCLLNPSALPSDCGTTDIGCICGNEEFVQQGACCVYENCPEEDVQAAVNLASSFCDLAGAQVSLPTSAPTGCSPSASSTASSSGRPEESSSADATSSSADDAPEATSTGAAARIEGAGSYLRTAAMGVLAALAL